MLIITKHLVFFNLFPIEEISAYKYTSKINYFISVLKMNEPKLYDKIKFVSFFCRNAQII